MSNISPNTRTYFWAFFFIYWLSLLGLLSTSFYLNVVLLPISPTVVLRQNLTKSNLNVFVMPWSEFSWTLWQFVYYCVNVNLSNLQFENTARELIILSHFISLFGSFGFHRPSVICSYIFYQRHDAGTVTLITLCAKTGIIGGPFVMIYAFVWPLINAVRNICIYCTFCCYMKLKFTLTVLSIIVIICTGYVLISEYMTHCLSLMLREIILSQYITNGETPFMLLL